jgi:disulfide bond formation protein DsbB
MTSRTAPIDKLSAGAAFVLGLAAIGGAWGSQLIGGLVPCDLCLEQRMAYYWGLPLLALVLIFWNKLPRAVWLVAVLIVAALFLWSTYMGSYHAGVEWGFFPGPTKCTGIGEGIDFGALSDINAAKVVPCDKVQFRFLGISLAGYNALVSLAIVALLAVSIMFQYRGKRV